MSLRLLAAAVLLGWVGVTLVLSELSWFRRVPLTERLAPYVPRGRPLARLGTLESFWQLLGPLARSAGSRAARVLGASEDAERRLWRIHSELDVTAFRVRQLGWALAGFGAGTLAAAASRPPLPVVVLCALGAPLLAFLIQEEQLARASAAWQRRVFLELPVVAEQLAMLIGAGYSLMSALNRIALRGHGACARDLGRVTARVSQGLTEDEALAEWAETAEVTALDRLVKVLELHRQASDLGALLTVEARGIRRDVQREVIETMERRGQQVWIPVTVATLVPGVILISIPFLSALSAFRTP